VRFGRWDEIVGVANPAPDLPYVTAIWNYAQALAALRQGRTDAAVEHHAALAKLAADPVLETLMVWDRYPLSHATRIAERTVAAELALARKDTTSAIAALRQGVMIEDSIPYDEPPGWHAPVRQTLGVALLQAGQAKEAEAVYREELRRNPVNAWSLTGLAQSLAAQGKKAEAAQVEAQRVAAMEHADVKLEASRI
jgi:tetratricopeptide (TPR) repeat protein